jgi:hypothetical protein
VEGKYANRHMYELSFSNKGGLVMAVTNEWTYKERTKEVDRIPAQVWRLNETKVVKTFIKSKEMASIQLDPLRETADINTTNNSWNTIPEPSKFTIFKQKAGSARDLWITILDTKWKIVEDNSPGDNDLKQMFVYNLLWNADRSVLVYPGNAKNCGGSYPHFNLSIPFKKERDKGFYNHCSLAFLNILNDNGKLASSLPFKDLLRSL